MTPKLKAAIGALQLAHAEFAKGALSSSDHSRARETAIADGLLSLAESHGTVLEGPLHIDSRGEFRIVVPCPSPGVRSPGYGKEFADALTRHNARTGIAPGAHLLPESSWCYLNHFDAERLLFEQLSLEVL